MRKTTPAQQAIESDPLLLSLVTGLADALIARLAELLAARVTGCARRVGDDPKGQRPQDARSGAVAAEKGEP